MASVAIYDGNPIWNSGSVPYGFYNDDLQFQTDAVKTARFVAQRLGYPLVDVELDSGSMFTAFEEAVTTYGNEVYAYKVRENFLSLEGSDREKLSGSLGGNNDSVLKPNFESIVRISKQYGTEALSGGDIDLHKGSINLTPNRQDYNIETELRDNISGSVVTGSVEIKRVFFQEAPPIVRFFDPYAGTGTDVQGLLETFGFGSFSPGINFLLLPIYFDIAKIQAIDFNDTVRKSNFSFELHNKNLRIFPIPNRSGTLWVEYIKTEDRQNAIAKTGNYVSNVSNVPYANPEYAKINSVGRQWIYEYTLAICKEMLGYVRGKYGTVPIPGAEVTLNHGDLITAGTNEKQQLIERLRLYLDETSRDKLLERRSQESDNRMNELKNVPFTIYIG